MSEQETPAAALDALLGRAHEYATAAHELPRHVSKEKAFAKLTPHVTAVREAALAYGRAVAIEELERIVVVPGSTGKEHWFCACPWHFAVANRVVELRRARSE